MNVHTAPADTGKDDAMKVTADAKEGVRHWRPFPWNLAPDSVAVWCGVALVAPVAPFMGILIGSAELTWALAWRAHALLGLQFINKFVLSLAERAGNIVLKDKRNFPYIPYILFLALWAPMLFGAAVYCKLVQNLYLYFSYTQ